MVAADCAEPPHVHVRGRGGLAKVWLDPIRLERAPGCTRSDIAVLTETSMRIKRNAYAAGTSSAVVDPDVAAAHPDLGLVVAVRCDDEGLYLALTNGREVSSPLTDFPRLAGATPDQRANWVIEGFGTEVHWPDIDEDIGVNTLLGVTESEIYDLAGFERFDERGLRASKREAGTTAYQHRPCMTMHRWCMVMRPWRAGVR